MSWAERSFAKSSVHVAERVLANHSSGYFSGEWSFRWRMREGGWRLWKGETIGLVAQPQASSPGSPPEKYRLIEVYGDGIGGLRLLSASESIGYYGETLGFWPIGWSSGFQEEVKLWQP